MDSNPIQIDGAIAGILAGVLLFVGHLINLIFGGVTGTVTGLALVLLAHTVLVFAFVGLFSGELSESFILARLGMILGILGTVLVAGIVMIEIAQAAGTDTTAVKTAVVVRSIHLVAPLVFVAGMILFGLSIMITRALPFWGGLLLIVGTVVFALGSFFQNIQLILSALGGLATGTGFVWLSLALMGLV